MKQSPSGTKLRHLSSPLPRELVGRMAAVLMVAGTVVSVMAEAASGHFHQRMLISGGLSLVIGAVLWFVPWRRSGAAGTIGFFVLGIAALVLGEAFSGDDTHAASVPVFLIALFAWNGLAHQRWMSLKLAPLVSAVYLVPVVLGDPLPADIFAIVFTVPFAVLVGETISWITDKLTTAENERLLNRHRADFLTAAQHELRTPLTTVTGYARVLAERGESLTTEQRIEFAQSILRSGERMNNLLRKLDDIQARETQGPIDLTELGLLAPHYSDEAIDLEDPLRGETDKER